MLMLIVKIANPTNPACALILNCAYKIKVVCFVYWVGLAGRDEQNKITNKPLLDLGKHALVGLAPHRL
jgi:hypothetical protein